MTTLTANLKYSEEPSTEEDIREIRDLCMEARAEAFLGYYGLTARSDQE